MRKALRNLTAEPAAAAGAVTGAVTSTLGIVTACELWSPAVAGAVTTAAGAWIAAVFLVVRGLVTPARKVALTTDQAAELEPPPSVAAPARRKAAG